MSIIGTIYEDVTTDVLGVIGTWQWLVTITLAFLMIPSAFNQYQDMCLLKPSKAITCIPPEHIDVVNASLCSFYITNNATEEIKCNKWQIKLLGLFRLEKIWLIFCNDKFKLLSTTMICRLGFMFGCVIFGFVSDSFGRKKAILINISAEAVYGLILTFCNAEAWFLLLLFLRSLFASANLFTGIILICEIASNSWRTHLVMIVALPRVLATTSAVPLANSLPNLETLNFTTCVFCIICIAPLRWLPESPQWLMYSRKIALAEKILYKAATKNKVKLCSDFRIRPVNHKAYNSIDEERTCISIFYTYNTRVLVILTLIFWALYDFLWRFLYITTYSNHSQFFLETLGFLSLFGCLTLSQLNRFKLKHLLLINVTLMGISTAGINIINRFETKCNYWAGRYTNSYLWVVHNAVMGKNVNYYQTRDKFVFSSHFSRRRRRVDFFLPRLHKRSIHFHLVREGDRSSLEPPLKDPLCIFEYTTLEIIQSATLGIGMIGHSLLLNITPRLFAINIRATIFGCCHSSGQFGTIICYLLLLLDLTDHKSLVFIQIGATFVLSALCYVIPDVDGRELPDVIEDMDYFSELSKPLRWATQKTNSPSQEEVEMRIYSFGSTIRNSSLNSYPMERVPAHLIGFKNMRCAFSNFVRNILNIRSLH